MGLGNIRCASNCTKKILFPRSSRCTVRDVTLFSASFMAVTEFDGRGENRYSGVRVVRRNVSSPDQLCATSRRVPLPVHLRQPPPSSSSSEGVAGAAALQQQHQQAASGRLCLGMIASNADVFHSSGVRRGPTVEGCEFTVAMDDYFNVHSRAQLLVSRNVPAAVNVNVNGRGSDRSGGGAALDESSERLLILDGRLGVEKAATLFPFQVPSDCSKRPARDWRFICRNPKRLGVVRRPRPWDARRLAVRHSRDDAQRGTW